MSESCGVRLPKKFLNQRFQWGGRETVGNIERLHLKAGFAEIDGLPGTIVTCDRELQTELPD
jgi:hypothetical protein